MPSESLIVPTTGEVISSDDPVGCLRVLSEIRDLEGQLRELKGALTQALAEEFSRQGTKTLELGSVKAELRGGSEVVWDVEILEELRELGLPDERMDALVTTEVTYKVNARVAKMIAAANERYAAIIERAQTTIPKAVYVVVKK
jgi:hypothetical protein